MNVGASGLMFLPLPLGGIMGITIYVFYYAPRYEADADRFAPHPVPPEYRLPMAQWGGLFFATSFFWFGWTSFPSISYWAPLMSGLFMGLGTNMIFLALFNYTMCAVSTVPRLHVLLTVRFPFLQRRVSVRGGKRAREQYRRAQHVRRRLPALRDADV